MRRFHRGLSDLDEIIGRLIAACDDGGIAGWLLRSGGGPSWPRQVRDECVTFLLAGHETFANALTSRDGPARQATIRSWTAGEGALRRHPRLDGLRRQRRPGKRPIVRSA